nr:MAG TPA: Protein of unknown function (DUF2805) [Caudoviricetes sp.]
MRAIRHTAGSTTVAGLPESQSQPTRRRGIHLSRYRMWRKRQRADSISELINTL